MVLTYSIKYKIYGNPIHNLILYFYMIIIAFLLVFLFYYIKRVASIFYNKNVTTKHAFNYFVHFEQIILKN